MPECEYFDCSDHADGNFQLAPAVYVPVISELPPDRQTLRLCHWHSLLVGDHRLPDDFGHRGAA